MWDTRARIRSIKVTSAATGWTIRIVEMVDLVELGKSKSLAEPSEASDAIHWVSIGGYVRMIMWKSSSNILGE